MRATFHDKSLKYVNCLQSVEDCKKFELVEEILLYNQAWSNWFNVSSNNLKEHESFNEQIKRQLHDLREKVVRRKK